jgi:glucose-1-phosphate thymidylyltransferase
MRRIVEKPDTPVSRLANIGLYYIRDWRTLFEGITQVLAGTAGKGGEYYLTDAFQYMVDHGRRLLTAGVGGWYDCGKVDTLLETNAHLLRHGRGLAPSATPGVVIHEPVRIEPGVVLRASTIGPNVTVEEGSVIEGSTVSQAILGRNVCLRAATVERSLIGDDQVIEDRQVADSVIDGGEAAAAR